MPSNIIFPEGIEGPLHNPFIHLMDLIPEEQRTDKKLQRLIAFRLKLDGEDPTRAYILKKIEHATECRYTGDLYDFMKDDRIEISCGIVICGTGTGTEGTDKLHEIVQFDTSVSIEIAFALNGGLLCVHESCLKLIITAAGHSDGR